MTPAPGTVNPLVNLIPALGLFLIMYLLLIRPQQRRQRELATMIAGLRKHDEVVTAGGVHGTIVQVNDDTIVLRVDDHVKLEVDKSAVTRLTRRAGAATP